MRRYCYLVLTCSDGEKESIAEVLLKKRLIACAKFMPLGSMYWWQDKVIKDSEAMILMESAEDLFDTVELEVGKIHNYDTFVLAQIPIDNLSKDAKKWLESELKNAN